MNDGDRCILVILGSESVGDVRAVITRWYRHVMRIDTGGVPLPPGEVVTLTFQGENGTDEISARAVVREVHSAFGADGHCEAWLGLQLLDFDGRPPLTLPDRASLH